MARDRGQVTPLVALIVLATAGAALLLVALGERAVDQAQAQTAADAAALAGAAEGRAAAERVAAADRAELVDYRVEGRFVRVVARVGDATAAARAERTDAAEGAAYSGADGAGRAQRAPDTHPSPGAA